MIGLLIASSRIVPRRAGAGLPPTGLGLWDPTWRRQGVKCHGGQAPTPTGRLPGDRDGDDRGPLVPVGHRGPAVVRAPVRSSPRARTAGGERGAAGSQGLAGGSQRLLV